ncbi:MAG: DUF2344 domain-containing protein [Planctomycetota bacterium]|nr:MAG: DUF2344 domain-containing protein [Planctomycetota bacterium]
MAIRFAIDGDLRFISHHDSMRLFERALSRAQLPVKFSEGYNPRPRLSLPVPRAVGVAGEAEIVVVGLSEPVDPKIVLSQLAEQMPASITLKDAWGLSGRQRLYIDRVDYVVEISLELLAVVSQAVRRIMKAETWLIERSGFGDKPPKTIDLRSLLLEACIDSSQLRWTVGITQSGTIRVAEFLSAVGLDPRVFLHHVRRTAVHWR